MKKVFEFDSEISDECIEIVMDFSWSERSEEVVINEMFVLVFGAEILPEEILSVEECRKLEEKAQAIADKYAEFAFAEYESIGKAARYESLVDSFIQEIA